MKGDPMSAKPSVVEVIVIFLLSVTAALCLEPLVFSHRLGPISQTPGDVLAFYLVPYLAAPDALTIIALRICLSYAIDVAFCFAIFFAVSVLVHRFMCAHPSRLSI
jgi:hypothetical protein